MGESLDKKILEDTIATVRNWLPDSGMESDDWDLWDRIERLARLGAAVEAKEVFTGQQVAEAINQALTLCYAERDLTRKALELAGDHIYEIQCELNDAAPRSAIDARPASIAEYWIEKART